MRFSTAVIVALGALVPSAMAYASCPNYGSCPAGSSCQCAPVGSGYHAAPCYSHSGGSGCGCPDNTYGTCCEGSQCGFTKREFLA